MIASQVYSSSAGDRGTHAMCRVGFCLRRSLRARDAGPPASGDERGLHDRGKAGVTRCRRRSAQAEGQGGEQAAEESVFAAVAAAVCVHCCSSLNCGVGRRMLPIGSVPGNCGC